MRKVIAIDGPSGVGKSSVSKKLAEKLSWVYLDTGAMYRAVALAWLRTGNQEPSYGDPCWLKALHLDFKNNHVFLNKEGINHEIRSEQVSANASLVSAHPAVRHFLTEQQRQIASLRPCVLDGRDIGTVVFPDAFFKVFLTADSKVRAYRRWLQQGGDQGTMSLDDIQKAQNARDLRDQNREVAPLVPAADAMTIDTTSRSENEVVDLLYSGAITRLSP